MNTAYLLMAEYETGTLTLDQISERYLGIAPRSAEARARSHSLPFPTFRLGDGNKAPRLVHLQDLADFIDRRRAEAKKEFDYCQ
ncbi:MAG: pyocin activator PrtN family protein [Aeromonas sp.]